MLYTATEAHRRAEEKIKNGTLNENKPFIATQSTSPIAIIENAINNEAKFNKDINQFIAKVDFHFDRRTEEILLSMLYRVTRHKEDGVENYSLIYF